MQNRFTTDRRGIKLGVAPVRRTAWTHKPFNLPVAIAYKEKILAALQAFDCEILSLEGLTEDGLLFNVEDADRVADVFIRENVDAVFVPHCNFGSEESVARLCKKVGKPVLLWGPKDEINPEDFYRYRDSQCGLFATSKILSMYGVPFTYIENCSVDDPTFAEGFQRFLAVVSVVKAFRNLRIGQIGARPAPFASVKCNEMELLQKFGIEILPMTMTDLRARLEKYRKENGESILRECAEMRERFESSCISDEKMRDIVVLKRTVEQWAEEERLSAIATQCWGPMVETAGVMPCFALSEVCDDGLPFICEEDVHGAITAVLAMAATRYEEPIFLADITIRHPENPNAELLWHCGVFAKSLARYPDQLRIANHYNRLCPAVGEWELKEGLLNILRFDGFTNDYRLLLGKAQGISGPKTVGAYLWMEVDDWSLWEKKLIYGPYIHHCVGIYRDIRDILEEACRYIPGLEPDRV
ncbi:MAG: fucose isomerase [Candidatus Faecivicinus sp.]|nr:fucose isomerase [Candidatus Faecivicinus sp.]